MYIPGLYKVKQEVKTFRFKAAAKKKNYDVNKARLLFADPRGGSTWLTEVLLKLMEDTALVWEPLHIDNVDRFKALDFGWRQYIPASMEWPEAKEVFDVLFQGRLMNSWLATFTTLKTYNEADKLFFKFCRGAGVLEWLVNQYNFEVKPIYLVRHPFAVVASQMRQGGWTYAYSGFQIPSSPFSDILYEPHRSFLETLQTKEEALVATWCLTNQSVLKSPNNNKKWLTLTYEDLVMEPVTTLRNVLNHWKMDAVTDTQLNDLVSQPSKTTIKGSAISGEAQLSQWKKRLSKEQLTQLHKVLEHFEIDAYGASIYPNLKFH